MPWRKAKSGKAIWVGPKRRQGQKKRGVTLANATGKAVVKAFGGTQGNYSKAWDAFHPSHLPLPRPVAPYTVVRTTLLLKSKAENLIFGTFQQDGEWSCVCALAGNIPGNPINSTGNTKVFRTPFPGGNPTNGSAITGVPSAFSVQVMNPNALQTTKGIVAGAVMNTQVGLGGATRSWRVFGDEVMSFQRPRLLAATKLALRGIQSDAMPLNMNKCSEFTPLNNGYSNEDDIKWDANTGLIPVGWSPISFVNKGWPDLELNYLVTIEWRIRFDMQNPAVASHSQHGVSSDFQWAKMINDAVANGHGIMDIADRVAEYGGAAYRGARAAAGVVGGVRRALPMLGM